MYVFKQERDKTMLTVKAKKVISKACVRNNQS